MKKILLLSLVLILSVEAALCAGNSDEKRNAQRMMFQSHKLQHDTCLNVVNNFRFDHQFGNYMKYRCQLFESDRQRLLNTVFTITSKNNADNTVDSYPVAMSAFAVNLNNNEINTYKMIVQEYCKYNAYKFTKKDAQACSTNRINSLFYTTP